MIILAYLGIGVLCVTGGVIYDYINYKRHPEEYDGQTFSEHFWEISFPLTLIMIVFWPIRLIIWLTWREK